MITHPPHVAYAQRMVAKFDRARTTAEAAATGIQAAEALRVLLYEPVDGWQCDDVPW